MHQFRNDYSEGAAPRILQALIDTNDEQTVGYTEGDPYTDRARELILDACGLTADEASVEFGIGGTSVNMVGVSGMLRDYEGVICTRDGHINTHETGAVSACGRTVLATDDADGFLTPDAAERVWRTQTSCGRHMVRPAVVYVTNATELGGVWDRARLDEICDWAHERGLRVFLDGARLGSALTSEGCDLTLEHIAHVTDAFTIGGTKNGMLFGEAVVIRDPDLRRDFPYLIKERGGLMAKGRLLGVQFATAFAPQADGGEALYWQLARNANARAASLRAGMVALGYEPFGDSTSNQQFFVVTNEQGDALERAVGCETYFELEGGRRVIRFVCSWATTDEHVDEALAFAKTLL